MAKSLLIEDVKDLDAGDVVARFEGKIIRFIKWMDGVGKDKDGTLQILTMKDSEGDTITVKLWDHERVPEKWKGQTVTILAHKGKSGITGVFADDNEFDGKEERILRLTSSAEVVRAGSAAEDDDEEEEDEKPRKGKHRADDEDEEDRPGRKARRFVQREESDDDGEEENPRKPKRQEDPVLDLKDRLTQLGNAYALTYKAVCFFAQKMANITNVDVQHEHVRTMTSTLFIAVDRAGYVDEMPTTPLKELDKAGKSKAEEEEEAPPKKRKSDED